MNLTAQTFESTFESLSVVIEHTIGELISSSTLKRLWGCVSLNPTPRIATSTFFSSRCQTVAELAEEAKVTLGWAPNRLVVLD